MRILDLDLDFFLNDVAHWPPIGQRLDPEHFKPWPIDEVWEFLEERCGLREPLSGWAVEEHDEVFELWRGLVDRGAVHVPFHLTHVDAHADLGLGDRGYVFLMTELLFEPVEARSQPPRGPGGLEPGNYVAFAVACRWLSDITYVYIPGGGSDLLGLHMENYDSNAKHIQLKAIDPNDESMLTSVFKPTPVALEPRIPIRSVRAEDFVSEGAFDFIFLARSPAFTPPTSDEIYAAIRDRYIKEPK